MNFSTVYILLLTVAITQVCSEDAAKHQEAPLPSVRSDQVKRDITPESSPPLSLSDSTVLSHPTNDTGMKKRKRKRKIADPPREDDNVPEKRKAGGSSINSLNTGDDKDMKRESQPESSGGAPKAAENQSATKAGANNAFKREVATVPLPSVGKTPEAVATPEVKELIEKIYEEEKDMKILMQTIVREEKHMEKMLEKIEALEARVEAQTMERKPKHHSHHRY